MTATADMEVLARIIAKMSGKAEGNLPTPVEMTTDDSPILGRKYQEVSKKRPNRQRTQPSTRYTPPG